MAQIWQVYGPNHSDDSRVSAPDLGIYEGEREVVIDWVALTACRDIRDHLEGRKHPRAEMREVKPKVVTAAMVDELKAAQKATAAAQERLRRAQG